MNLNLKRANEILQKHHKRKQVRQFINNFALNVIVVVVLSAFMSYMFYKVNALIPPKPKAKRTYTQMSLKKSYTCAYKDIKCLKAYARKQAKKARINPDLFLAIISTESNWNAAAVNKRSHDYGLTQINKVNIKNRYELIKIRSSAEYSIDKALEILLHFKKSYSKLEPDTWYCRYNIGYKNLPETCNRYLTRLSQN